MPAETSSESEKIETPSLVPGDFFYFTKILLEKIQLALTFDDVKEARLISQNMLPNGLQRRSGLFADGNEEAALETMTAAIEHMENADAIVEEQHAENQDDTMLMTGALEEVVEDDGLGEVKSALSQNIIALTAAMEKVKNPKAKAALQKNIDKSYAKLAKKLEKLEEKQQKKKKELSVEESAIITELKEEPEVYTMLLRSPCQEHHHLL